MEILQFLTSFLSSNQNVQAFAPIFKLLSQNSFDIKKTLANLDFQSLKPIIKELLSNLNNFRPTEKAERYESLSPISNIADKDIVFALNRYLTNA